jgi:hypothetical protein
MRSVHESVVKWKKQTWRRINKRDKNKREDEDTRMLT